MTGPSAAIVKLIRERAMNRCEYCRMHQSMQVATFHIEHVIPLAAGGTSSPDNLALACPTCNLHKSQRINASDPQTSKIVPLFHPRLDQWEEHFGWSGHEIVGKTPLGRATVAVLDLNHARRLKVRAAEETFGLFPPVDR